MPVEAHSFSPLKRLSVKHPLHYVDFFCSAPKARSVMLVGDFNEWNPMADPMQRMPDGGWWRRMTLTHGHHHYCFLVDGEAMLDPRALGTVGSVHGRPVSLIAVS